MFSKSPHFVRVGIRNLEHLYYLRLTVTPDDIIYVHYVKPKEALVFLKMN